jgi:hypothetical protein
MSAGRLGSDRGRLSRLGSALSQLVNVALFNGHNDESLSARAHRQGTIRGKAMWLLYVAVINRVFFWEADHCAAAHREDIAFAHAILEARP